MKKIYIVLISFSLFFIYCAPSFAQSSITQHSKTKYQVIEANYLKGLKSENLGLRISCAYFLGELKSRKAVIHLMNMLNNENDEGARIMAAWSLVKIGDPKGIILLKEKAENCDCKSVKCFCEFMYNHYVLQQEGKLYF